jgi:hypothetical protein
MFLNCTLGALADDINANPPEPVRSGRKGEP